MCSDFEKNDTSAVPENGADRISHVQNPAHPASSATGTQQSATATVKTDAEEYHYKGLKVAKAVNVGFGDFSGTLAASLSSSTTPLPTGTAEKIVFDRTEFAGLHVEDEPEADDRFQDDFEQDMNSAESSLSETESIEDVYSRVQAEFDAREQALNEREQSLNDRETALNDREAALHQRENDITEQEEHLRQEIEETRAEAQDYLAEKKELEQKLRSAGKNDSEARKTAMEKQRQKLEKMEQNNKKLTIALGIAAVLLIWALITVISTKKNAPVKETIRPDAPVETLTQTIQSDDPAEEDLFADRSTNESSIQQ